VAVILARSFILGCRGETDYTTVLTLQVCVLYAKVASCILKIAKEVMQCATKNLWDENERLSARTYGLDR
jgi:hypothetical protein